VTGVPDGRTLGVGADNGLVADLHPEGYDEL
jgi:hypothetical protein